MKLSSGELVGVVERGADLVGHHAEWNGEPNE